MTSPNKAHKLDLNSLAIGLLILSLLTTPAESRSPERILGETGSDLASKKDSSSLSELTKNSTCGKYCKMCDTVTLQCKFCATHTYLSESKGCIPIVEGEKIKFCEHYSNRGICISCEYGHYYQLGECKSCKVRDSNLVDCRLNTEYGTCKKDMVYDLRSNACVEISEYGETAFRANNCVLVKSETPIPSENLNISCLKCAEGFSQNTANVCEFIREPNCKEYDYSSNRCSLCTEGYRLKQIDNDIKSRKTAKQANEKMNDENNKKAFNNYINTGFIGLRIFNPDTSAIVRQIVDEVEVEQHVDCIKCPSGCERCIPGEGKKIAMDARKWIDTRCVYCVESIHNWPRRYHDINGTCKLFTEDDTKIEGYNSMKEIANDIGTPAVHSMEIEQEKNWLDKVKKQTGNTKRKPEFGGESLKAVKPEQLFKVTLESLEKKNSASKKKSETVTLDKPNGTPSKKVVKPKAEAKK